MVDLREIQSEEEYRNMLEQSAEKPVLLFKHSTTCPISANAYEEYQTFLGSSEDNVDAYLLKVIENRQVSDQVAQDTEVKHESPQIFVIKNKEVLWHTSHSKITADAIGNAL